MAILLYDLPYLINYKIGFCSFFARECNFWKPYGTYFNYLEIENYICIEAYCWKSKAYPWNFIMLYSFSCLAEYLFRWNLSCFHAGSWLNYLHNLSFSQVWHVFLSFEPNFLFGNLICKSFDSDADQLMWYTVITELSLLNDRPGHWWSKMMVLFLNSSQV